MATRQFGPGSVLMAARQPNPSERESDPRLWVEAHGDSLFAYALARVRNRDAAEDLVQETFLAALRGRSEFEGRSSQRTWLISILRHKIVDHVRHQARERASSVGAADERDGADFFDENAHWRDMPAKWPADPRQTLEQAEFWAGFEQCLTRLPAGLADTFCLRELEGLDNAELCKLLEISSSNLWTRLHRARMLLRQCLEQNWFTDERS